MTAGLERRYGARDLHYVTFSCWERRPLLDQPWKRDVFLETLEEVRRRYKFHVFGYVVMPEHVHLMMSEAERGDPSLVVQVLKQRSAQKLLKSHPFQKREGWAPRF
jgi:REP-associated tyrosine transposase